MTRALRRRARSSHALSVTMLIALSAVMGGVPAQRAVASTTSTSFGVDAAVTAEQRDRAAMLLAAAQLAPPNATGYVHVEDAWDIVVRLRERPIADAVASLVPASNVRDAWAAIARESGDAPDALFRDVLGGRVSIITQDLGDRTDWVVVLHETSREVSTRAGSLGLVWDPAIGAAVGLADGLVNRYHSPRLNLRFDFVGEAVAVSPIDGTMARSEIARHVTERLIATRGRQLRPPTGIAAREWAADSLWASDGIAEAAALGTGSVAGWFRGSDADGGGWTAMLLDVPPDEDGRVRASVTSRSDTLPFARPNTRTRWTPELLPALEQRFIMAMAEPADIGLGTAGLRLERALGHALIPAFASGDDRRLLVLGEVDGRPLSPPVERPVPALALVIPTNSPLVAFRELDGHMAGVLEGMDALRTADEAPGSGDSGAGSTADAGANAPANFPANVPANLGGDMIAPWTDDRLTVDRALGIDGGYGRADLESFWRGVLDLDLDRDQGAATDADLPLPWGAIDLSWGVATVREKFGVGPSYIVVATHESHLLAVVHTIEQAAVFGFGDPSSQPVPEDAWASRGSIDGIRAALHLDGLADLAPQLTEPGRGDLAFTLRTSLDALGRVLGAAETCQWQLRRPGPRRMRLDIDVRLAGPPTQTVSSRGG